MLKSHPLETYWHAKQIRSNYYIQHWLVQQICLYSIRVTLSAKIILPSLIWNCYKYCMIFTLLAAIIAHIPVGQKQHKQERTAGAIQSRYWARLTTVGATPGCLTCTKINTKLDVLIDANNYSQKLSIQ